MRKRVALCLLLAASGCSMAIRRVDPDWNGRTEPSCDGGVAPVIVDALISVVGIAVMLNEGAKSDAETNAAVGIGGGAVGLVFGISSVVGEEAVRDCRNARLIWRTRALAVGRPELSPPDPAR